MTVVIPIANDAASKSISKSVGSRLHLFPSFTCTYPSRFDAENVLGMMECCLHCALEMPQMTNPQQEPLKLSGPDSGGVFNFS